MKKDKHIDISNTQHLNYELSNISKYGAETNKPLSTLKTLEISYDNNLIYTSGYDVEHLIVLEINELKFREYLKHHTDCIFCVATCPWKKILVTGGRDRKIAFWKIEEKDHKISEHLFVREYSECREYVLSIKIPEKADSVFALFQSNLIFEFDSNNFNFLRKFSNFYNYFNDSFFTTNSTGDTLVGSLGSNSQTCQFIRFREKRKKLHFFHCLDHQNCAFDFLPKSNLLVVGTTFGVFFVFDMRTMKQIFKTIKTDHRIYNFTHNTEENMIFLAQDSGIVKIFRIGEGRKISFSKEIKSSKISCVEAIEFSRDQKHLIIGGGCHVEVFRAQ